MTDLSSTAAHEILEKWFTQQVDTLTAVGAAIESMNKSIHRAEVRIKLRNKRPKLRFSQKSTLRLRRYVRNNSEMRWLLP